MDDFIFQPLLLGISTGIFCFSYCVPFIAPYLVAEQRKISKNVKIILEFILGRLIGYILFGAIFGYLGEKISSQEVNLILTISLMILAIVLIFYALGFFKPKGIFCSNQYLRFKTKAPLLMGFLMGINICPPFLMSLAYVFTLHSVFKGIIYFLMFFLGTTLYFLPTAFLGYLGKMREFRLIARTAGLIVGFAFLAYGIYYIIRGLTIFHVV
jgi:sulfite exporter TauE/SafE